MDPFRSSEIASLLLYAALSVLRGATHPLAQLSALVAAPLIALAKGRSVIGWLYLGALLGPLAMAVALLPPLRGTAVADGYAGRARAFLDLRIENRAQALWMLLAAWLLAYFWSYDKYLAYDFPLTIQMIPGALAFGWLLLPGNLFRVITTVEPPTSAAAPVIGAFWALLIYAHVKFWRSRRQVTLVAIAAVLLLSTHGCYQWANYSSGD